MSDAQGPRRRSPWILLCLGFVTLASCEVPGDEIVAVLGPDAGSEYPLSTTESFYLTMRDGVRLAVDLHLPGPLEHATRLPTIVSMTRYWRATEAGAKDYLGWRIVEATQRGFAFLVVDERGTGASFGTWPYPWSNASRTDFAEVVDWVVAQEWSNGKVGSWGGSYLGMTAQLLTAMRHPAVRVSVPTFTQWDLYTDMTFPGGIMNDWFLKNWSEGLIGLDSNRRVPGVKRVDADLDGSLLAQALAEHADNGDVYLGSQSVTYRDEMGLYPITFDGMSAHAVRQQIEASGVPLYHWGGWLDGAGAHSVLSRFMSLSNPQQAVIGAWVHGGWTLATPYAPPGPVVPSEPAQWHDQLDFIEQYLADGEAPVLRKTLHYYTMGAEVWRETDTWPVTGMALQSWYLAPDSGLSASPPETPTGADYYAIDFTATTGTQTRWHTPQDGVDVVYPDRRREDAKLLTYTSPPLGADLEITGYPIVTLYASSTHEDGAFYVYLEDVDPSGRVTYVTEGQLRALHRSVPLEAPPYELRIPYHSFKEKDGRPLVPGETAEIRFGLLPTSVVLRRGHRIRIAIAGHDNGVFTRIPLEGNPTIKVDRNSAHASRIDLPVVRRR